MTDAEIERVLAMHRIYAGPVTEGLVRCLDAAVATQERLRAQRRAA